MLGMAAAGIVTFAEGEEGRARDAAVPLWVSWLVAWWCLTAWMCLLARGLWLGRRYRRAVARAGGQSQEHAEMVRQTPGDPAMREDAGEHGEAPPLPKRAPGLMVDAAVPMLVAAVLSGAIVAVWPDPFAARWRPRISALLADQASFEGRPIRIRGVVRSEGPDYPNAGVPSGRRWMVLDDDSATLKVSYHERLTPQRPTVGQRVEVVGYVMDLGTVKGPGPWWFLAMYVDLK